MAVKSHAQLSKEWAEELCGIPPCDITGDQQTITDIIDSMSYIDSSNTWYSEYQLRYSSPAISSVEILSSLYQDRLVGGSLVTNGSFATFSYTFTWANNSNVKTVFVKFSNQNLISGGISIPINTTNIITVSGQIKVSSVHTNSCVVTGQWIYNGSTTLFTASLTNVNFLINNYLIFQAEGFAYADITAIGGQGNLFPYNSSPF